MPERGGASGCAAVMLSDTVTMHGIHKNTWHAKHNGRLCETSTVALSSTLLAVMLHRVPNGLKCNLATLAGYLTAEVTNNSSSYQ